MRIEATTDAFVKGIPDQDISMLGKLRSLNSVSYYIDNGRAWINSLRVDANQIQKFKLYSAIFKFRIRAIRDAQRDATKTGKTSFKRQVRFMASS